MRIALLAAAAAVLAACGATQLPESGESSTQSLRSSSWMAREARNEDLLYVSDQGGAVYVFSYPGGKPVGLLTGLQGPGGLCSDAAGDVFVADTPSQAVFEYKHGGEKPARVIGAFGYPEGCAVDGATGNIAVTTYQSARSSGPGSVSVYTNTKKRKSTTYVDPSFNEFFFCGYDDDGNLYVDGVNSGTSQAEFAVLPKAGTALRDLKLDRRIGYPGGIQWDGTAVAIEDLSTDTVYRFKVSGAKGRVVGATRLARDHTTLLAQFWIQDGTIVVPYGKRSRGARRVGFWPYPSGGAPEKALDPRRAVELLGTTISRHS